jgi:hypothetical protein
VALSFPVLIELKFISDPFELLLSTRLRISKRTVIIFIFLEMNSWLALIGINLLFEAI